VTATRRRQVSPGLGGAQVSPGLGGAQVSPGLGGAQVSPVDWRAVAARPCPVASTLDLVGDRWSMLVVRDVMYGNRRFDDLVERLGVSRATLSDRLRRLTEAGILAPTEYADGRGRIRREYRLTERGTDLRFVLIALREWGDRHLLGASRAPIRLVAGDSGRDVRLELVDSTGRAVDPTAVRTVPGPGFRRRELGAPT
jgi:DNA-binding HxlR family transcriptional regulator